MWPVAVHWVYCPWGFLDDADHCQPPPVFRLGPPCLSYKQPELATKYAGLGDSQVKANCESRLSAASAGPGAH